MPKRKYVKVLSFCLYEKDVGNNSISEILIISPAINENKIPSIKLLINLDKKQYEIKAPNGSDKAEILVYKKAFFLL